LPAVKLIEIPAGEFWMGSDPPEGGENERPRRKLATAAYRIGELPVTNADFAPFVPGGYAERGFWTDEGWAFIAAHSIRSPRFWDDRAWAHYLSPEQPIVGVSWYEADAFARSRRLRLPSEAEWERAARGDDGRRFPWGDEWRPDFAAHRGGPRQTLPAGHFAQNVSPYGARDCAGNVWEWCSDEYAPGLRSARGGSWNAHPPQLRCASRNAWPPWARYSNLGFRAACGSGPSGAASRP
jgi:formylglycine-generating enzyme required for sulfatase activity